MSLITQDIIESIEKETEEKEAEYAERLRVASKDVLIGLLVDTLEERIPIEPSGYLALRQAIATKSGQVPVELLLWAHSLAQWISCATIDELDGSFLDLAIALAPNDRRVLYAVLKKQPNIEGDPNQAAFEKRIITRLLNEYPEELMAKKALAIMENSAESLPLDFVNCLPNPLEGVNLVACIEEMRGQGE